MSTYLFIGGPADGRRISIPDRLQFFRIADEAPLSEVLSGAYTTDAAVKTTVYEKQLLGNTEVFIAEGTSVCAALEKLVSGYPPPNSHIVSIGYVEKILDALLGDPIKEVKNRLKIIRELTDVVLKHKEKHGA